MPKGQRIIVFLAVLILLLIVYWAFKSPIDSLNDKGIVIMSSLIMLSFTTLLAEHFFTRPTDVVASSVSILLLLSPLHAALKDMGAWYWIFWFYSCAVLLISLISLLLLDSYKSPSDIKNKTSAVLKTVAIRFGNGRFMWFSLFALSVLFYVDSQSPLFIVLFIYASVLLLIDPKKAIFSIKSLVSQTETEIAKLFGIQSSSAYLARIVIPP